VHVNRFVAPEMWACKPYDEKIDVYAFAIILWMLMSALHTDLGAPYGRSIPKDTLLDEFHERRTVLRGGRPEPLPQVEVYGPDLLKLMEECWKQEPTERPTFESVVVCLSL
jgi:hypothetical protein